MVAVTRVIWMILMGIAVAGCSGLELRVNQHNAQEGRLGFGLSPWVHPEYELDEVSIRWVRTSDEDWRDFAQKTGMMAAGMAIPDAANRRCTILANPPQRDGDAAMQILGHEVSHCFMGIWHGPWNFGDVDDVELGRVIGEGNTGSDSVLAILRQIMPRHAKDIR